MYQQIAAKAEHLGQLGMSYKAIARALKVDDKTVAKAIAWSSSSGIRQSSAQESSEPAPELDEG